MKSWYVVCSALSFVLTMPLFATASWAQTTNKLTNSEGSGGDPTAIWEPGAQVYLGARTDNNGNGANNGVTLWRSTRIEGLFVSPDRYTITPIQAGTTNTVLTITGAEAPALIEWNNHLYLDYRDNSGLPDNHQVLVNADPTDPFCEKQGGNCWTQMADAPRQLPGRDWSYLVHGGNLWCFYNDQVGDVMDGIWVVQMMDPKTPSGTAVQISEGINPNLPQSTPNYTAQSRDFEFRHNAGAPSTPPSPNTQGGTNEAPQGFTYTGSNKTETTFVTYSANSYKFGDYSMGLLTFSGTATDDLNDASKWTKSQQPFLQASNYSLSDPVGTQYWVCNVGSNAVVPDHGDTGELWMIYNGKFNCKSVSFSSDSSSTSTSNYNHVLSSPNDRTIRTQKIFFTNSVPNTMEPWIDGGLHSLPVHEPDTPAANFLNPLANGPLIADDAEGRIDANGNMAANDLQQGRLFYSNNFMTTSNNPDSSGQAGTVGQGGSTTYTQTLTSSVVSGSYFVVPFIGPRIQLWGPTGPCGMTEPICTDMSQGITVVAPTYGHIEIYVDGNMKAPIPIDLSTPVSGAFFDSSNPSLQLTSGPHTLTVIVDGTPTANGHVLPVALDYVKVFNN